MASIGCKLKKTGIVMTLLTMVVIGTACEDQIDNPKGNPSGEKTMEVSLNIGLADEVDGFAVKATPSSTKALPDKGAFNVTLEPSLVTKANAAKPDKLYNLEIVQYDNAGNYKSRAYFSGETAIGARLDITLTALDDCQLVLVAWGQNNSTTLGTKKLSDAQEITMDASIINEISETDMNKMPYVLHLEHVCVKNNTIQSIEGKDVRLLLRRLATRLTLNWSYSYTGYQLKQILLESIPLNYKVVPKPEDGVYPSLLDQFTTIQLTAAEIASGSYSCWIPANVRGTNGAATSQIFRTKSNAPTGSAYVSFIAGNTADPKKKLNYRVYLGGNNTSDFNLYGNTNYTYTVNITHTALPVNDYRVTIIDPIPASQSNSKLVPTANCFMVAPGGAFCFDPFAYQQNGTTITNSTLKGWSDSQGGIAYVKLLWQTKENGDIGDPVMGVVNSADDHTNIVDIKKIGGGDVSKTAPITNINQGRIYCHVAPNTTGGSGVIAAYNTNDQIIWSWHVWVTDYNPSATGNASVYEPANKRKQKYTYRCDDQLPMMDRNLGAKVGYTEVPRTELERSMANGLHYQWGRKDPFPSSYSNLQTTEITVASDKLTKGMLNLYQPDGISFFQRNYSKPASLNYSVIYRNPTYFYETLNSSAKWQTDTQLKNEHDPCPVGWRVASYKNYESFFTQEGYTESTGQYDNIPINIENGNTVKADGGALLYYEGNKSGPVTYFRFNGYQRFTNKFTYIGLMTNIWCRENKGKEAYALSVNYGGYPFSGNGTANNIRGTWNQIDAHSVRCIQERE